MGVTSARRIAWASLLAGLWLAAAPAKSGEPTADDGAERAEDARETDAAEDSEDVMRGFEDDGFPSGTPGPSQPGSESDSIPAPIPNRASPAQPRALVAALRRRVDHRGLLRTEIHRLLERHEIPGPRRHAHARRPAARSRRCPREWQARAAGSGFYDFAYLIKGRGEYTNAMLNSYEWDADVGELWVEGPLLPASISSSAGRS